MINSDKEFLNWIYERMICVHGEKDMYDYMINFKSVIDRIATVNNERMAELKDQLNKKWMQEYQTLYGNYANHDRKINELLELLKQEWNRAIDEVIELIPVALDSNMTLSEIIKTLEYLKSS